MEIHTYNVPWPVSTYLSLSTVEVGDKGYLLKEPSVARAGRRSLDRAPCRRKLNKSLATRSVTGKRSSAALGWSKCRPEHRIMGVMIAGGGRRARPGEPLRLGVTYEKSVTLGNVTMSHRTRERPAECLASLSHSTMIGLPRAQH
ncbi:hypothetical protein EVAR_48675_1 [Eumeta japonica]|uniref:Uncharacterized protein n=1 Tax=Eumeta variegata TaxID=151549 RepID=A0A4C1X7D4_EUMVA|nr:hypothetical protein EVAR_48675_1 [Eumeta japonica]